MGLIRTNLAPRGLFAGRIVALALLLVLAGGEAPAADPPLDGWQPIADGVEYREILHEGLDAHVVRVDLGSDSIRLVTTQEPARGLTISEFARQTSAIVAVNGDYFDVEMRPLGLAMGACGVWGKAMQGIRRQEVVGVGEHRAQIFPREVPLQSPEPWMTGAVSGWPTIVADCDPVASLPGSDHFTRAPHPRTAVGLSADGRQLYLVVVDGRREGVPGVTLPELAQLLDELGACTAVNLDGGGSSTMWIRDRIVNQPSDGVERAVVNHLAVVAAKDYVGCAAPSGDWGGCQRSVPAPPDLLDQRRRRNRPPEQRLHQ